MKICIILIVLIFTIKIYAQPDGASGSFTPSLLAGSSAGFEKYDPEYPNGDSFDSANSLSLKSSQLYGSIYPGKTSLRSHTTGNCVGQAVAGIGLSAGFSFMPLLIGIGSSMSEHHDGNAGVYIASGLILYIFGAGTGVHWVARAQNPEIPFWGTIGYSLIGGAAGAAVLGISSSAHIPVLTIPLALLCPVICSMLYASNIADWPEVSGLNAEQERLSGTMYGSYSHRNLIESQILFNVRLMHIEF